jgi:hypothetical protein
LNYSALRPTEKKSHWARHLIATNGIFAAPNRISAAKLTAFHRMVEQKIFVPYDEASQALEKKFCTME